MKPTYNKVVSFTTILNTPYSIAPYPRLPIILYFYQNVPCKFRRVQLFMVLNIHSAVMLQDYLRNQYSYDEMLGKDGNLRPHWDTFFQSFNQLGNIEIQNRNGEISRVLKENGVTYNTYDGSSLLNRDWNVDSIPFLIGREEWEKVESALIQRAELLNLLLQDIYGDQKLIKNGILPLELIYNHIGFLRQCAGIKLPGKHSLVLYSADLARSPDGKLWIISDRTQAPSGSGYALENRTVMTRILPELFNGLKVRHLSPWFDTVSNSLNELGARHHQNPGIVILTPGPGNETYFEHSYLASHLGYTLVQGNDLMVKNNFVWLKTLSGLEKVDVIIRRIDDMYCDPLELKADSQLGVAGLLQVVRSGNVSIANPIGSSVLENPGLMPFLQNISKYFFGRELIMPTIGSWWCGQPKELKYVLSNIQSLVIKRIYRGTSRSTSVDGASLSVAQMNDLKLQINKYPFLYVGQEKIGLSSTPSLVNGKIEPRKTIFRSFLVSNGDSYTAMAGGLSRTSSDALNFLVSNQSGGSSKDTWIISPEPANALYLQKKYSENISVAATGILPSHTAENLFWVGRYTERLLGNARFHRTVIQFIASGNRLMMENDIQTEQILLRALTHYTFTYPGFINEEGDDEDKLKHPWPELTDILFNAERTGSLKYDFVLFIRAVHAARDHWSTDTWRVLRGMEEEWSTVKDGTNPGHLKMQHVLDSLVTSVVAFIGMNRESISREQGWIMMDMGRKIEQCLLLTNMLRATLVNKYDDQVDYNLQESVLISNEGLVNFRYKYRSLLQLPLVLDLMIFDPNNPRSLVYQLGRLKKNLENLPKTTADQSLSAQDILVAEAYDLLKGADKDQLSVLNMEAAQYLYLDNFLSSMYELLSGIQNTISKTYFKHAQSQKQLFSTDQSGEDVVS
ncbi:MAG: circularly permuted type 2 ATP-grasp protein [Ferruginibacter sp.]|nr:circularly permuted type 2 ATP-grasp protein [Ferruginibacter sp.]